MRAIWLIFGALPAVVLAGGGLHRRLPAARVAQPAALPALLVAEHRAAALPPGAQPTPRADSIVRFALAQAGTRYTYAGVSPATGFDCSGFIQYVFGRFGVPTPHSTALLIEAGQPVARSQAQPGDIVVFTGTAATSTTPGHAGIVISALGEIPLRFVHASSAARESGVKVSQVENSGYERRFLQVRRVLGGAGGRGQTALLATPQAHPAGAVAALSLPPAKALRAVAGASAVPAKVAPLPVHRPVRATAAHPAAKQQAYPPAPPAARKATLPRRAAAKAKFSKPAPHPAAKTKRRRPVSR